MKKQIANATPNAKETLVRDISRIALRYCNFDCDFSHRTCAETRARLLGENERDLGRLKKTILQNKRIDRLFFLKMYLEADGSFEKKVDEASAKVATTPIIGNMASVDEILDWKSFQKEHFATCHRTEPRFMNCILLREVWKTTLDFDNRKVGFLIKGREFSDAMGVRTGCVVAYNTEDKVFCPIRKTENGFEAYYYETRQLQAKLYGGRARFEPLMRIIENMERVQSPFAQKALDFLFGLVVKKNRNKAIQALLDASDVAATYT